MRVGFLTGHDIYQWSRLPTNDIGHMGNASFMARALIRQGCKVIVMSPPHPPRTWRGRLRERFYEHFRRERYLQYAEPEFLRALGLQVRQAIDACRPDVVVSNMARYVAYVHTPVPLVTWRDATFAGALEIHRDFRNVTGASVVHGHEMERAALRRSRLSIFRSEWAARSALEVYGAQPERVAVIPTGGNIDPCWHESEVSRWIAARSDDVCRLLFVGVDWNGKGGPRALEIVHALNGSGMPAELTVVGCVPDGHARLASYVKVEGFIDKGSADGAARFAALSRQSHFLLLPTTVDTYGNVFPEANAHGVPCLASRLAGIPTIIRDGANGYTFDPDTATRAWVQLISDIMRDYDRYRALALASYRDFELRLSWKVAAARFRGLLETVVER